MEYNVVWMKWTENGLKSEKSRTILNGRAEKHINRRLMLIDIQM